MTTLTYSLWTASLAARGWSVLSPSHAVPVELWLWDGADTVLHLRARGTTVVLRRFRPDDLTTLTLRSECDCEEHRNAGAAQRTVLAPDAAPSEVVRLDGRIEFGWSGVEAGRLDVPTAAPLLDRLLAELGTPEVLRPTG